MKDEKICKEIKKWETLIDTHWGSIQTISRKIDELKSYL